MADEINELDVKDSKMESMMKSKKAETLRACQDLEFLSVTQVPGCGPMLGYLLKRQNIYRASELYAEFARRKEKGFADWIGNKFGKWNKIYAKTIIAAFQDWEDVQLKIEMEEEEQKRRARPPHVIGQGSKKWELFLQKDLAKSKVKEVPGIGPTLADEMCNWKINTAEDLMEQWRTNCKRNDKEFRTWITRCFGYWNTQYIKIVLQALKAYEFQQTQGPTPFIQGKDYEAERKKEDVNVNEDAEEEVLPDLATEEEIEELENLARRMETLLKAREQKAARAAETASLPTSVRTETGGDGEDVVMHSGRDSKMQYEDLTTTSSGRESVMQWDDDFAAQLLARLSNGEKADVEDFIMRSGRESTMQWENQESERIRAEVMLEEGEGEEGEEGERDAETAAGEVDKQTTKIDPETNRGIFARRLEIIEENNDVVVDDEDDLEKSEDAVEGKEPEKFSATNPRADQKPNGDVIEARNSEGDMAFGRKNNGDELPLNNGKEKIVPGRNSKGDVSLDRNSNNSVYIRSATDDMGEQPTRNNGKSAALTSATPASHKSKLEINSDKNRKPHEAYASKSGSNSEAMSPPKSNRVDPLAARSGVMDKRFQRYYSTMSVLPGAISSNEDMQSALSSNESMHSINESHEDLHYGIPKTGKTPTGLKIAEKPIIKTDYTLDKTVAVPVASKAGSRTSVASLESNKTEAAPARINTAYGKSTSSRSLDSASSGRRRIGPYRTEGPTEKDEEGAAEGAFEGKEVEARKEGSPEEEKEKTKKVSSQ